MLLYSEYICYDACHLRKYSLNPCRRDLTPTTKILSDLTMAVDKMHMAGHVDSWYKKTCDPHLFTELSQVYWYTTYTCEQFTCLSVCLEVLPVGNEYCYNTLIDRLTQKCASKFFSWLSRYGKMTQKMSRHTYFLPPIYL